MSNQNLGSKKEDPYKYFLKKQKEAQGIKDDDDDDDEDISITDEDEEEEKKQPITSKSKKTKISEEEMDFNYSEPDDFELSDSLKKKPLKPPELSPVKKITKPVENKIKIESAKKQEDEDQAEETIEEEEDKDLLQSTSNQQVEIEEVEKKDDKREKITKQIKENLQKINSKFDNTEKNKAKIPVQNPQVPKKESGKVVKPRQDSKAQAKREPSKGNPKQEKEVDKTKPKQKAQPAKSKKDIADSITKLKTFKKPDNIRLGGTEEELDKIILMNLNKQKLAKKPSSEVVSNENDEFLTNLQLNSQNIDDKNENDGMPLKKIQETQVTIKKQPKQEQQIVKSVPKQNVEKQEESEEEENENLQDQNEDNENLQEDNQSDNDEENNFQINIVDEDEKTKKSQVSQKQEKQIVKDDKKKTITKKNVPIALEKPKVVKEDPKLKAKNIKLESGFSAQDSGLEQKLQQEQLQKTKEAKEKFQAIQNLKQVKAKEEMERLRKLNMGAAEFMKRQQEDLLKQKLNKNIQKFKLQKSEMVDTDILKNKGKGPIEATMVHDAESLQDQLTALVSQYKLVIEDAKQVSKNVFQADLQGKAAKDNLNKILNEKKLLVRNGKIEKQPELSSQNDEQIQNEINNLLARSGELEKKNPLEVVVRKFAEQGFDDLTKLFQTLDDNGDGVLTLKEIKDGLKDNKIDLNDQEWKNFINALDENSDGVLTLDEWLQTLTPKVTFEIEFQKVLGNVDDPLSLEEKCLDLQYQNRKMQNDLKELKSQLNQTKQSDKTDQLKKIAYKIKVAETDNEESVQIRLQKQKELEDSILKNMQDKDQIKQQLNIKLNEKQEVEKYYSDLIKDHKKKVDVLEQKYGNLSENVVKMKLQREQLQGKFDKNDDRQKAVLDQQNKIDRLIQKQLNISQNSNQYENIKKLDLKTLNEIRTMIVQNNGVIKKQERNLYEQVFKIAENQAATKIQSVYRGNKGRMKFNIFRFQKKWFYFKLANLIHSKNLKKKKQVRFE